MSLSFGIHSTFGKIKNRGNPTNGVSCTLPGTSFIPGIFEVKRNSRWFLWGTGDSLKIYFACVTWRRWDDEVVVQYLVVIHAYTSVKHFPKMFWYLANTFAKFGSPHESVGVAHLSTFSRILSKTLYCLIVGFSHLRSLVRSVKSGEKLVLFPRTA